MTSKLLDILGITETEFREQETRFEELCFEEHSREDFINGFEGKTHTDETKLLLSQITKEHLKNPSYRESRICRGAKNGMYGRNRSGSNNPRYGVTVSNETRLKMSKANKGRPSPFKGQTDRVTLAGRKAIAEKNSKTHVIKNPLGQTVTIHNLMKFCRDNDLNYVCMAHVMKGRNKSHKGWTRAT